MLPPQTGPGIISLAPGPGAEYSNKTYEYIEKIVCTETPERVLQVSFHGDCCPGADAAVITQPVHPFHGRLIKKSAVARLCLPYSSDRRNIFNAVVFRSSISKRQSRFGFQQYPHYLFVGESFAFHRGLLSLATVTQPMLQFYSGRPEGVRFSGFQAYGKVVKSECLTKGIQA